MSVWKQHCRVGAGAIAWLAAAVVSCGGGLRVGEQLLPDAGPVDHVEVNLPEQGMAAFLTLGLAPESSTDFGAVAIQVVGVRSFVVTNVGQLPSAAITILVRGIDFSLGAPSVGACISGSTVLAYRATCTVEVDFQPLAIGDASGSLSVASDVGGTPPALPLTGAGHKPGLIREFMVSATASPLGITLGPDGNLWFTESLGTNLSTLASISGGIGIGIGNITPLGVVAPSEPAAADMGRTGLLAYGITSWSDGNLWFTESPGNALGQVTTAGGVMQILVRSDATGVLSSRIGITVGSDGNLWFVDQTTNAVGFLSPAPASLVAMTLKPFPIPTPTSQPVGITAGPDGALWFTERAGNKIGRVTTAGVITEFIIPSVMSGPVGIAAGPDGNLWFVEQTTNRIGRVSPAGIFSEFSVPTPDSEPFWITAGPDGALWFTELKANKIGRLTVTGAFDEYTIPTAASSPAEIVLGPDGNLWFTEFTGHQIGRITP